MNAHLRSDHARQRFGRGLCVAGELVIAGSSPATVCAFAAGREQPLKSVNLTLDLRNAIHGVEVWPFDRRLADWQIRCKAAVPLSPAVAPSAFEMPGQVSAPSA